MYRWSMSVHLIVCFPVLLSTFSSQHSTQHHGSIWVAGHADLLSLIFRMSFPRFRIHVRFPHCLFSALAVVATKPPMYHSFKVCFLLNHRHTYASQRPHTTQHCLSIILIAIPTPKHMLFEVSFSRRVRGFLASAQNGGDTPPPFHRPSVKESFPPFPFFPALASAPPLFETPLATARERPTERLRAAP
ncbi:hypothetical protein M011DRAFT_300210 [Sporormia fimetaria CBS 119925]|uniref:Secreted protein n=1 Tax=Sporormia fimetaria CBS 119925 TaxID=1340428 RepID=A0A6A6UUX6_9PLEO|nr:hypothetical protein M011DRAFT_300210 [Sporormia fimetaria CBS 119925]